MFRTIILILILSVVIAAGWALSHSIPLSGKFQKLEATGIAECRRVEIAPGTEDITIDRERRIAFVSAADRRAWYSEENAAANPQNGIYVFALDGSDTVTKVSPPIDGFLPHGVSLWHGEAGERRLFVVNHPPSGGDFVEIFDVNEDNSLTHVESVSFPEMSSPNDVLAVGPRQFYATNDKGLSSGVGAQLEAYLALPLASVAYWDGVSGRVIKKGFTYANGINKSADGETVYVAEIIKRRIGVFSRDKSTNELTLKKYIPAGTAPDNIEVGADGALWVGGHSRIFDFLKHAKDPEAVAPSHVVRIDPDTAAREDILISRDGEINASSVAAATDDLLLVGAVFDGHILVCPRGN